MTIYDSETAWFLTERTTFIRSYYDTAAAPFLERLRRIEAGEPPFDNPPIAEDGEPPYLTEWCNTQ